MRTHVRRERTSGRGEDPGAAAAGGGEEANGMQRGRGRRASEERERECVSAWLYARALARKHDTDSLWAASSSRVRKRVASRRGKCGRTRERDAAARSGQPRREVQGEGKK